MVDLARAHGIAVVLASVLPVSDYPWLPGTAPAPKVRALNTALKRYADAQQLVYLDYYTPMANAIGGLDPQLADDGVHPTAKGYAVMAPLAEAAVKRALQQSLGNPLRTNLDLISSHDAVVTASQDPKALVHAFIAGRGAKKG